jgi:hypothetical protein
VTLVTIPWAAAWPMRTARVEMMMEFMFAECVRCKVYQSNECLNSWSTQP